MYINVIYPKKMPSFLVKRKSIHFFLGTEYVYRNQVFVHPKLDSVFFLNRNSIHICIPDNNDKIQNITIDYLNLVFGDTVIGLKGLNKDNLKMFESLNYITI